MSRALLVLAALVGTTSVAAAGPYVGLGLGGAPAVSSSIDGVSEHGRAFKLLGGYRFAFPKLGALSIEASLSDFDTWWPDFRATKYATRHLGAYGKYNFPLGAGFEVFGRLGIQNTWQSGDDGSSFSGAGFGIGGGAEYQVKVATVSGSIFVDYMITHSDSIEPQEYSLTTRQWMLGVTVGF